MKYKNWEMEMQGTASDNMQAKNTDLKQWIKICDAVIMKKAYKYSGQQFKYEFATCSNHKYNL